MVLGILLVRTGRWAESSDFLERAVEAMPRRDEAIYWLAVAKKHTGAIEVAIDMCRRALDLSPGNPIVANELGLCYMTVNRPSLALPAFQVAVDSAPKSGAYLFNLGLALSRLDRIYKARDAFASSIRLEPDRVEAYLELVRILEILDARAEVVTVLQRAVERIPADFQLQTALAAALSYVGRNDEAEEIFVKAMESNPASGNAYGLWLQQRGRFDDSVACFLRSLHADPVQGVPFYGLTEAKVFEIDGKSWTDRAEHVANSNELDLKGRTYLLFALAKAFERQKHVEKVVEYYDGANKAAFKLYNEGRPFDRAELESIHIQTIDRYPKNVVQRKLDAGSGSACPIFIVGMIRSGTTLLDQVLSSHPEVASAGEPVFWMREADRVRRLGDRELSGDEVAQIAQRYLTALKAVAGESPRISDKMPLNYAHLGLIHRVLPEAKIIHLRRNPLDTCFSIYTTYLGQGPNFAYDRSNIVFYYKLYRRLMHHWRSVFTEDQMIEVDYEDLVSDREEVARKLVRFCGLEWSDACLRHEQNESAIRTPSKWQARQPIYTSSVKRWAPYVHGLGELTELLLLNEP